MKKERLVEELIRSREIPRGEKKKLIEVRKRQIKLGKTKRKDQSYIDKLKNRIEDKKIKGLPKKEVWLTEKQNDVSKIVRNIDKQDCGVRKILMKKCVEDLFEGILVLIDGEQTNKKVRVCFKETGIEREFRSFPKLLLFFAKENPVL